MADNDAAVFKEAFPFMYEKQRRREDANRQTAKPMPDEFYAITFNEAPIQPEVVDHIVDNNDFHATLKLNLGAGGTGTKPRKSAASFNSEQGKLITQKSNRSAKSPRSQTAA
jgi:hypothetical protein